MKSRSDKITYQSVLKFQTGKTHIPLLSLESIRNKTFYPLLSSKLRVWEVTCATAFKISCPVTKQECFKSQGALSTKTLAQGICFYLKFNFTTNFHTFSEKFGHRIYIKILLLFEKG